MASEALPITESLGQILFDEPSTTFSILTADPGVALKLARKPLLWGSLVQYLNTNNRTNSNSDK